MFTRMVMNINDTTTVQSPVDNVRKYLESLPQHYTVKEEIRSHSFWKAVRSELLATIILVTVGCGALVQYQDVLKDSLALGLTIATLIQCFGNLSGSHMNPAVTIAMLVTGNISTFRAFTYIIFQCIGSILGTIILYSVTPLMRSKHILTSVHPDITVVQGFGIEFIISSIVVFTVMSNMQSRRVDLGFKALSIGLAYTVGHLFAFPYTGASMNPARSFGPAIVFNHWEHQWVYWLGPILGSLFASFTFEYTHDYNSPQLRKTFLRHDNYISAPSELQMSNTTTQQEIIFNENEELTNGQRF